jgi:hypothetical protein|tara:strand:+ start:242 stop:511 length:270 start_codon:yes stop_codon:yes gene_type:complete
VENLRYRHINRKTQKNQPFKEYTMNRTYLHLQETEGYLLAAASRIYAARLQAPRSEPISDDELMKQAITEAIKLAKTIDDVVVADSEVD